MKTPLIAAHMIPPIPGNILRETRGHTSAEHTAARGFGAVPTTATITTTTPTSVPAPTSVTTTAATDRNCGNRSRHQHRGTRAWPHDTGGSTTRNRCARQLLCSLHGQRAHYLSRTRSEMRRVVWEDWIEMRHFIPMLIHLESSLFVSRTRLLDLAELDQVTGTLPRRRT